MKFGVLSLAAAAALALSAGSASAQWGNNPQRQSYSVIQPSAGGHLDYHNGHYHYHNGSYVSGPLYPANNGLGGYATPRIPGLTVDLGDGWYDPIPSRGSWSSSGYSMPTRGTAYGSYRWRW